MGIYSINEKSPDYSKLDKNFKSKKYNESDIEFIEITLNNYNKYGTEEDKKNFDFWLSKKKKNVIIAYDKKNKIVAGFICCNKDGTIAPFRVKDEYKGRNIGDKLLSDCITKFDGNMLGVFSDNEIAINLYKKHGFKIVDKNYKEYKDGTKVYLLKRK